MRAEIIARIAEGRLTALIPLMARSPLTREILLTPAVAGAIDGPWVTQAAERLCGQARALLEGFIQGDVIVARMPPSRSVHTLIALLDPPPDNVWEFRIGSPRPGIRIFGRFAERDTFIATNWTARGDLLDPTSGKDDLRKWRDQIVRCKREWANLFPAYPPLNGSTIHEYISNSRTPI